MIKITVEVAALNPDSVKLTYEVNAGDLHVFRTRVEKVNQGMYEVVNGKAVVLAANYHKDIVRAMGRDAFFELQCNLEAQQLGE